MLPIANQVVVHDRMIDRAHDRATVLGQGDQRAEEIAARDERLGPVDGIEYPLVLRVRLVMAELLAENAVVGELAHDGLAHGLLGIAVGNCDRRLDRTSAPPGSRCGSTV